jgi:hypothetical protein
MVEEVEEVEEGEEYVYKETYDNRIPLSSYNEHTPRCASIQLPPVDKFFYSRIQKIFDTRSTRMAEYCSNSVTETWIRGFYQRILGVEVPLKVNDMWTPDALAVVKVPRTTKEDGAHDRVVNVAAGV